VNGRLIKAAVVVAILAIIFAAAQLVRPERTNPAFDVSQTIEAQVRNACPIANA
jgi:hypothetical protein